MKHAQITYNEQNWRLLKEYIPPEIFDELYSYEMIQDEWSTMLGDWITELYDNPYSVEMILLECRMGLWGKCMNDVDDISQ